LLAWPDASSVDSRLPKMFRYSHYSQASALGRIAILLLALLLLTGVRANEPAAVQTPPRAGTLTSILDLIYRQKYNEAITRLEQILERDPGNGEALTYMATANLYHDLNFTEAQGGFKNAFKAGGGATLFVTHSHEKFSTDVVVDYCRGWLHLRADGVEFVPTEGTHGFKLRYDEVQEFRQNRLSKISFHIKAGGKSQNFRGRSNRELEVLLITALFKSFTQH
jgi:tetratricopeptide (TPR) repeat protein